jgi:hypothetical protein
LTNEGLAWVDTQGSAGGSGDYWFPSIWFDLKSPQLPATASAEN